jgi:Protein of unknown function (DUF2797)
MQTLTGYLKKMLTQPDKPVTYHLVLGEHNLPINDLIGKKLHLSFQGRIFCIQCGRQTRKSFQQGYCYPCMLRLAECNYCIIHPQKCQIEHGNCRADDWAHSSCGQPHIVYLANSSGLKVGITRLSQIPTRWIDQGASQAIPIFQVTNRYQSGILEVCLKQYINDRTDWRKMLKGIASPLDLLQEREILWAKAGKELAEIISKFPPDEIKTLKDEAVIEIDYPIQQYPTHLKTLSFDQSEPFSGILQGIKGQYLLLDTGVINIRKFSGYEVELKALL